MKKHLDQTAAPSSLTGRTYSLYGTSASTTQFYKALDAVVNDCLERWNDLVFLIQTLRELSLSKRKLKHISKARTDTSPVAFALSQAEVHLAPFILDVEAYLASLSFFTRWRSSLGTTREQYYLAVIEIELTNRLHLKAFSSAGTRIALLPHCLRDLTKACQSAREGIDTICKGCSERCYINATSRLLRAHSVQPYIWNSANLKTIIKKNITKPGGIGILGIACIPELVRGMRRVSKFSVPVIGLPLDMNRCARWFGEFLPNTITIERLEAMLQDSR